MMIIEARQEHLPDVQATLRAGARLAPRLQGGMVVTLSGELGTGKTTIVRGMLQGLGWTGTVKSPSYTLVEHYIASSLYFYHFDFYRFDEPDEWERTGFSEYFRPDSVCVIEWPERIAGLLSTVDLAVRLEHADAGRILTLQSQTLKGSACLVAFDTGQP